MGPCSPATDVVRITWKREARTWDIAITFYEDRIPALNQIHAHFCSSDYFLFRTQVSGSFMASSKRWESNHRCIVLPFPVAAISVLTVKTQNCSPALVSLESILQRARDFLAPRCDWFMRIPWNILTKLACEPAGWWKAGKGVECTVLEPAPAG